MSRAVAKILLNLAASDYSLAELHSFLAFVEREGAKSMVDRVKAIRTHPALGESSTHTFNLLRETRSEKKNFELTRDVESLLLKSANLSKTEATEILLSELLKRYDEEELPSHRKVGFQVWISRLADAISPSELLHISSRIRNEIVHGNKSPSDWPISDNL